jgi:hypothetical protein
MLVLMLNLHFKNLQFLGDYVGFELTMQVAAKYDQEVLTPLLLTIYMALHQLL